jgi:GNAT superfamily N-acetyltransferase
VREHDAIEVFTAEERPDLWERARSLFTTVWPEYNNHGNHTSSYFRTLYPTHAQFQVLLYDAGADSIVGRGRAIPFRWDGTLADLPAGMDAVGKRAIGDPGPPTALSALAAEVAEDHQGRGLSSRIIEAMAAGARRAGFTALVAPVRPSWKDRYPLTPIERYADWRRPDGLPFDPWLRVHVRLGATLLRTEPKSLEIEAPVSDWEEWTGMQFPEDGEYAFPEGLAPLSVRNGIGSYWEPNIWMRHEV